MSLNRDQTGTIQDPPLKKPDIMLQQTAWFMHVSLRRFMLHYFPWSPVYIPPLLQTSPPGIQILDQP